MKNTMRIHYSLFILHSSFTKYDGTEEENQ